ncbi:hypothetical protein [Streptomyces sp. NPDC126503]|uniref:hypothetical protein n=1 Tax=Streptomyces sp. NPDC126503 TaxID=3155315 RepID=UPI00331EF196
MTQADTPEGQPARLSRVKAPSLSRDEKDEKRADFGVKLGTLLSSTGLSSRGFARIYDPVYNDSTIRKYVGGTSLPPWNFLRDLREQVALRAGDNVDAMELSAVLFTEYRKVLVEVGAELTGSDQNSLLLRLLEGEPRLAEVTEKLAEVTAQRDRLRAEVDRLRSSGQSGARVNRLRAEADKLSHQSARLARQRGELEGDMDRCRALLHLMEQHSEGPGAADMPAGPPPHRPPADPVAPRARRSRRWRLLGAAATVLVLVGSGVAIGIWAAREDAPPAAGAQGPTSSSPSASRPTPQETSPPSSAPTTPPATPASTAPEPAPEDGDDTRRALDKHLIGVYEITVSDGNALDIDAQTLNAPRPQDNEFVFYDDPLHGPSIINMNMTTERPNPNIKLGLIDSKDVPQCAKRTRLTPEAGSIGLTGGDPDTHACIFTSGKRWALVQAFTEKAQPGTASEVTFRIGFVK